MIFWFQYTSMVVEVLQIQMLTHHVFQGSFKIKRSKVIPLAGRPMLICFLSTGHYNFGWWQRAGFSCRVLPPGRTTETPQNDWCWIENTEKDNEKVEGQLRGGYFRFFFYFHPGSLAKWSNLASIFYFKWVGPTTSKLTASWHPKSWCLKGPTVPMLGGESALKRTGLVF